MGTAMFAECALVARSVMISRSAIVGGICDIGRSAMF